MVTKRLLLGCLVVCVVLIPIGVAAAEYSLSTDREIDVPDRDVKYKGETYSISHISRVDEGDDLTVSSNGPNNTGYYINIYNPDNQIADSSFESESASATFDMSFTPGSYTVAIEQNGDIKTVQPVVIKAYDVSHSAASSVEQGNSLDVTVDVTELSDEKDIKYVEVVLGNDQTDVSAKADKANGKYEASLPTDSLSAGTYSLFATVRGHKQVRKRDELLGFSDQTSVTVETPTPTPTPTPAGGGGGGGGGGAAAGATPSGEGTPTGDGTPTADETPEETLDEVEPATQEEVTIEDSDSESPGVSVSFDDTEFVRQVTFDNEDVSGSVTVSEYTNPPASVTEAIASQLAEGEGGADDAATSDDGSDSETTDGSDGSDTDGGSTDGASNGGATRTTVVSVADISPTSESAKQSSATVEMTVKRSKLSNPATAVIVHETSDGSWERLDTTIAAKTDQTVTLQAPVDSFSLFAVVDQSRITPTPIVLATPTPTPTPTSSPPAQTAPATPTTTPTPSSVVTPNSTPAPTATATPGASGPGFALVGALIALAVATVAVVGRRL